METLRIYFALTKPGIVIGNLIAACGGFFLASRGTVDLTLFLSMAVGLSCVMASGCVFNNYTDRDMDEKMERTKRRALVTNKISVSAAIWFGAILLFLGEILLFMGTTVTAGLVAGAGFILYAVVYSMWAKRATVHATLIGALSGAVPPVVGYVAVTNTLDMIALLLFLVLVAWQMPHFLAIALFRKNEYAAASIPVPPLVYGERITTQLMIVYTCVFAIMALALPFVGAVGNAYTVSMSIICLIWLHICYQVRTETDTVAWARRMFSFSLLALVVFSLLIAIDWM